MALGHGHAVRVFVCFLAATLLCAVMAATADAACSMTANNGSGDTDAVYADPVSGDDANTGAADAPFKTAQKVANTLAVTADPAHHSWAGSATAATVGCLQ